MSNEKFFEYFMHSAFCSEQISGLMNQMLLDNFGKKYLSGHRFLLLLSIFEYKCKIFTFRPTLNQLTLVVWFLTLLLLLVLHECQ